MGASERDRVLRDLSQLRVLQPDLTRDQAMAFFQKFHPVVPGHVLAACLDELDLPSTPAAAPARRRRAARSGRTPGRAAPAPDHAAGSRADQFRDTTGVPRGELAPSDRRWIAASGWLTSIAEAEPSDVVTARRILVAASAGKVRPEAAQLIQAWYQEMKGRPDLFDPRAKPRRRLDGAEGDPEKRLRKPATTGKKVFYREVLVGKRN